MRKYTVRELTIGSMLTLFIQGMQNDELMIALVEEFGIDFFIQMKDLEQTEENNKAAVVAIEGLVESLKNGGFA